MPIQSWGKSGVLAFFGPKIGHFGQIFRDMDFNFVLPIMSIDIKGQTKLEVNWTQINHFSLQKYTKMAISQNPILLKWRSPKSLLLLNFSIKIFETFRIDVNMDFASTCHDGFLSPKSKKNSGFFWIWAQNV